MTPVPLAYKFVATAVMLAEINYCASRLHLPIDLPVKESDIRVQRIYNPHLRSHLEHRPTEYGFAGRIDIQCYSFSFPAGLSSDPKPGKLRFITRLDDGYQAYSTIKIQGKLRTSEFLPQLVGIHATIDTNEAYHLATNWLMAIDVDVQRLNKEQPITVKQEHWGNDPLPIFDVKWGEGRVDKWGHSESAVVEVMIAGDTKGILHLRQNDDSYSKRPFALIKDMDKLLAIPDEEFLKYSPMERSNLVARFSAVNYLLSQTNTPAETNVPAKQ